MKIVLRLFFSLLIIAFGYGLFHKTQIDVSVGDKIIGFTVISGAFLFMPLFLYHRWKGKHLQDYTLNEENLKKMRERE